MGLYRAAVLLATVRELFNGSRKSVRTYVALSLFPGGNKLYTPYNDDVEFRTPLPLKNVASENQTRPVAPVFYGTPTKQENREIM
jgi:hypothetical protein